MANQKVTKPGKIFYRQPLDTSWWPEASCSKLETRIAFKLFFPEEETPSNRNRQPTSLQSMVGGNITEEARQAISICRTCPVVEQCRDYAVRNTYAAGIWGGTTSADRKRIRKNRGGRGGIFIDRRKAGPSAALSFIQNQVQSKENNNG